VQGGEVRCLFTVPSMSVPSMSVPSMVPNIQHRPGTEQKGTMLGCHPDPPPPSAGSRRGGPAVPAQDKNYICQDAQDRQLHGAGLIISQPSYVLALPPEYTLPVRRGESTPVRPAQPEARGQEGKAHIQHGATISPQHGGPRCFAKHCTAPM
jgi:hypothetical protein